VSWSWSAREPGGREVGRSEEFASQEEAEAWLGSNWEMLVSAGADLVVLSDDDKILYEMRLSAE
jgi:hypothetical protein